MTKLRDQGYEIGITDFITASNMAEVLCRMQISSNSHTNEDSRSSKNYYMEMLNDSHKGDVIEYVHYQSKV